MAYNPSKKEYLVDTTKGGVTSSTAAALQSIAQSAGINTAGMSTSQITKAIKAQANATGSGSNNMYGDTIGDATLKNFGYQVVNGEIVPLEQKSSGGGGGYSGIGLSTGGGYTMSAAVSKALDMLEAKMANPVYDTSNPFKFIVDYDTIVNTLNDATKKSYDVKTKEAYLGLNKAENASYANTINAISELRKSLAGSAASGASVGAANATALQALLGLGATNKDSITEALQGIQKISGEKQAAMAQNASNAIDISNAAKNMQGTIANEKYNAELTVVAEALAALGALVGTSDTNATNERMNTATNNANTQIANIQAAAQKAAAAIAAAGASGK